MGKRVITAADLFCGAGGTSTGLAQACATLGIKLNLIAVNHWDIAIKTHSLNHPEAAHFHSSLDEVDPLKLVPSGVLDLLVASPECLHHSRARGGKPINEQSRASAWRIVEWASKLRINNILIENVPEFRSWGPLIKQVKPVKVKLKFPLPEFNPWFDKMSRNGGTRAEWLRIYRELKAQGQTTGELKATYDLTCWVPCPQRKGTIYLAFLEALRAQGYVVEDRVLNAADYGDPTARERLFIQARLNRKRIHWPTPTHAAHVVTPSTTQPTLFAAHAPLQRHRPARDIIDWSLESESIFARKNPLKPNTIRRIMRGLEKFCGLPFIVPKEGDDRVRSIERPLQTITTESRGIGLCEPFIVGAGGPTYGGKPRSVERPLGTVLTDDHSALVQPFLVKYYSGHSAQSVDHPIGTICANYEHYGLCEAFIVEMRHKMSARSVNDPLSVVTTTGAHHALCQCFIVSNRNNNVPTGLAEPVPTLCTGNHMYLCQAFLSRFQGNHAERADGAARNYSLDEPVRALDTSNRFALVESYLVQTAHGADAFNDRRVHSLDQPIKTITAGGDGWGLVESFLLSMEHGGSLHSLDQPMKSVTANGDAWGLAQPFLIKYNGTGGAESIDDPLPTVTGKDRYGLVIPQWGALLDIRFRMLQPHELAAAMSFPKTYSFAGNREQKVKQIGNAVPVNTAGALAEAILSN